jgi:hypothetical protein
MTPEKVKRYILFLPILWLLWTVPGCTIPEPPQLVAISNPAPFKPKTPGEIKTLEEAMAVIITVTSKELGLPVVEPLYLHLYKNTESFAAYAGYRGRRLPHDVVQFAIAVAEESRFHINMEKVRSRPWSSLIRTLAHEYAHNIEYVLSVQRGSQWLREGFADWVAAKVLHSLGWQDYALSVTRAKLEVSRLKISLPTLSDLEESQRWAVWANDPKGAILTYRFAFLAVDRLIDKGGLQGITKYFSSQDFSGSFGLSWNDFETEFKKSLVEAKPVLRKELLGQKPEWRVGFQWQYSSKLPGRVASVKREIVREDIFEGFPSYVMRVGKNENFYTKDILGFLATASGGKVLSKRNTPQQYFAWPLEVGKEWRTTYIRENLETKSSETFDYTVLLANVEEVKVPAGTFDSFKVEVYGFQNGTLAAELWYSPKVRWFVKERVYLPNGVREEELVSFKVE